MYAGATTGNTIRQDGPETPAWHAMKAMLAAELEGRRN